jgi:hypothetical protein
VPRDPQVAYEWLRLARDLSPRNLEAFRQQTTLEIVDNAKADCFQALFKNRLAMDITVKDVEDFRASSVKVEP